jgi:hypothetical protein
VTGDIGADATAKCVDIGGFGAGYTYTLDLGGYTVTGYIGVNGNTPGAITVFNGSVTCNVDWPSTARACVNVFPDGEPTGQTRIHHLTVNAINTTAQSKAVHIINYGAHTPGAFPGYGLGLEARVDHVSITSPAFPTGRFGSIMTAQYLNVEVDHNYIHCLGTTSACQGIELLHAGAAMSHHNKIDMDFTALSDGRAVLCDGVGVGPGNTCDVYNNIITATNNRAIRYRGGSPAQNGNVYNNSIYNIQLNAPTLAAIHLGENDVSLASENIQIYNNTFELNGGQGIINTSATGTSIHDNTVTCYGGTCSSPGYFLRMNVEGGITGGSDATVKNTNLPGDWGASKAIGVCGTGGALTCTNAAQVSTVTYCNTGTLDVGTGATATESCP